MICIWCIKENATYIRKLRSFENKNANYKISHSNELAKGGSWIKWPYSQKKKKATAEGKNKARMRCNQHDSKNETFEMSYLWTQVANL